MNLLIHLYGMLCGLGSATLATSAVKRWYAAAGTASGFTLVAWWTGFERIPNPAAVGMLLALVAGMHLVRPGFFLLAAVSSGVLAGCWIPILRAQSIGLIPSILLATVVPIASMLLTLRRPAFASLPVVEDALLLVMVLGLAVAAAPQVAEGWRSAGIMNLRYETTAGLDLAPWILFLGCGSLGLGAAYALWWRRQ